jgi:hypothetical protein
MKNGFAVWSVAKSWTSKEAGGVPILTRRIGDKNKSKLLLKHDHLLGLFLGESFSLDAICTL